MKTFKKDGSKITFTKDEDCYLVTFSNDKKETVYIAKDKLEAEQAYSKFKSDIMLSNTSLTKADKNRIRVERHKTKQEEMGRIGRTKFATISEHEVLDHALKVMRSDSNEKLVVCSLLSKKGC